MTADGAFVLMAVIAALIVPNVSVWFMWAHRVDDLFIIERLG